MKLVAGTDPGMIQFEIRPLDRVPGFNYHTRISLRIHQHCIVLDTTPACNCKYVTR